VSKKHLLQVLNITDEDYLAQSEYTILKLLLVEQCTKQGVSLHEFFNKYELDSDSKLSQAELTKMYEDNLR
jgi:hypothetical protein